eukprot:scaffold111553_cov31-Tisochrysis_lutea.AAC.1
MSSRSCGGSIAKPRSRTLTPKWLSISIQRRKSTESLRLWHLSSSVGWDELLRITTYETPEKGHAEGVSPLWMSNVKCEGSSPLLPYAAPNSLSAASTLATDAATATPVPGLRMEIAGRDSLSTSSSPEYPIAYGVTRTHGTVPAVPETHRFTAVPFHAGADDSSICLPKPSGSTLLRVFFSSAVEPSSSARQLPCQFKVRVGRGDAWVVPMRDDPAKNVG